MSLNFVKLLKYIQSKFISKCVLFLGGTQICTCGFSEFQLSDVARTNYMSLFKLPMHITSKNMFQNVFSQFSLDVYVFTRVSFRISVVGFNFCCTGWRRPMGCRICTGHFLHKIFIGSFAESDLQLTTSYGSSPPSRKFSDSRFQRISHPSMSENVFSLFF